MAKREPYIINISGLNQGDHDFNFTLHDPFFELFDEAEFKKGKLDVSLKLEKHSGGLMILYFEIKGTVQLPCDRCGNDIDFPIHTNDRLYVKQGSFHANEEDGDNENVINIAENETEINLAQPLYEFISVSIPLKRVLEKCETDDSDCNKAVIEQLKKSEAQLNKISSDPRWDALKNIKLN